MTLREIERLAVVESQVGDLRDTVGRMDAKLDEALQYIHEQRAADATSRIISRRLLAIIGTVGSIASALVGFGAAHVVFH